MVGVGCKFVALVSLLGIPLVARVDAAAVNTEDMLGTTDESALTNREYFSAPNEWNITISPRSAAGVQLGQGVTNSSAEAVRQAAQEPTKTEDLPPGALEYVRRLKPIFVAEGVPSELVWLAEVESDFDTLARSPIGAVGLFQLMPDTAEWLGLRLTPSDQRLQPEKNARAAAQYLRYLHGSFHDWRLVIAAYNGGEGLVRRLIDKRGAHSYDEIASSLPPETQLYVPKVEATILRREGVTLEELPKK